MKKIKIDQKISYKKDETQITTTFGTTEEELLSLRIKCYELVDENDLNLTDLLKYLLDNDLISDAAGFYLLTLGLNNL